jgi:SAM-dependent methyltransferase
MKNIHIFDFDLAKDQIEFHNWVAITSVWKFNQNIKIILWLTKEITANYYLIDVMNFIEVKAWSEEFPTQDSKNDFSKFLCKLSAIEKYKGFALNLNDIHHQLPSLSSSSLSFIPSNPYEYPIKVRHDFIHCSSDSFDLDSLIKGLRLTALKDENFGPVVQAQLIEETTGLEALKNDDFDAYIDSEEGIRQLFIKKNTEIIHDSISLSNEIFQPVLRKMNERNIYFLNNGYSSMVLRDLRDQLKSLNARRDEYLNISNSESLVVNLGSGSKFNTNMVNTDLYQESGADLIFDLSKSEWPLKNDSVSFALCHSVLEHLSGDISIFFKELYRVMSPDGIIEFVLPHPRHDWFFQDPTHVRPMLPISFEHFDREKSIQWYLSSSSHTPLALYWNIDFKIISVDQRVADPGLVKKLNGINISDTTLAAHYLNNVIGDFKIILQARK